MRKLFIPPIILNERTVPFLGIPQEEGNRLFQNIAAEKYTRTFKQVQTLAEADLVVFPHEYVVLRKYPDYLKKQLSEAQAANKKIFISAYQDSPEAIDIAGVTIVRPSAYKSHMLTSDIIMPAYVEDLGAIFGHQVLSKKDIPIIGFVGKANFFTLKEKLWYVVKNFVLRRGPYREGIYFRRYALRVLAKSAKVQLHAIVRRRFSANKTTVEISPEQARREYVEAIQNAHFTLAPRGDGNYSLRFFETLSLGRIPVLIDTDTPLPLEDIINYDKFVVRVPWQDIDSLPEIVSNWYNSKTPEEWAEACLAARRTFESYLYMPAFIEHLLS
jgi:hypothetical protein